MSLLLAGETDRSIDDGPASVPADAAPSPAPKTASRHPGAPGRLAGIVASLLLHLSLLVIFTTLTMPDRRPPETPSVASTFNTVVPPPEEIETKLSYESRDPNDTNFDKRHALFGSCRHQFRDSIAGDCVSERDDGQRGEYGDL